MLHGTCRRHHPPRLLDLQPCHVQRRVLQVLVGITGHPRAKTMPTMPLMRPTPPPRMIGPWKHRARQMCQSKNRHCGGSIMQVLRASSKARKNGRSGRTSILGRSGRNASHSALASQSSIPVVIPKRLKILKIRRTSVNLFGCDSSPYSKRLQPPALGGRGAHACARTCACVTGWLP